MNIFYQTTGRKIACVPGLIHKQNFFGLIREEVYPFTDYIRGKDELNYTSASDLYHDIFGHMPLLTNKNFATFYQMFGEAAINAKGVQRTMLETLRWFTVEFGLTKNSVGMRIYRAGIISSQKEVSHVLSDEVQVIDFDPEKIVNQDYDVWYLQPVLFAINSFEKLETGLND